ncbi:hypothetical protein SDC9_86988 [bioreactor metagenome]|uniref:Uncharacterized protein n=1 Tax=bioreactor metagenome TaxID=1076179 RepID=A0A644ZJ38_9ZZZZ
MRGRQRRRGRHRRLRHHRRRGRHRRPGRPRPRRCGLGRGGLDDLGEAVHRVDGQLRPLGDSDGVVVVPDAVHHVRRALRTVQAEQHSAVLEVHSAGSHPGVDAVGDRLDVQAGCAVVVAKLLVERSRLGPQRRVETGHVPGQDEL